MEYIRGKQNKVADVLSRIKHKVLSLIIGAVVPMWVTEVVRSYSKDTKCKELIHCQTGPSPRVC
jgi:hypothetical protein